MKLLWNTTCGNQVCWCVINERKRASMLKVHSGDDVLRYFHFTRPSFDFSWLQSEMAACDASLFLLFNFLFMSCMSQNIVLSLIHSLSKLHLFQSFCYITFYGKFYFERHKIIARQLQYHLDYILHKATVYEPFSWFIAITPNSILVVSNSTSFELRSLNDNIAKMKTNRMLTSHDLDFDKEYSKHLNMETCLFITNR